MEAMALAVPTIGTAAGGVGEIIQSGVDGVLVPPGDPVAIADAICELVSDASRRRQLGENGRKTIVERFDSRLGASTLYTRLFSK
jgi:glycosyltransferase involved in cell wall biosynthesis